MTLLNLLLFFSFLEPRNLVTYFIISAIYKHLTQINAFSLKKNIFAPILVFMDIILLKWKPGFRMNITRNKGLKEGRGGGGGRCARFGTRCELNGQKKKLTVTDRT